MIQHSGKASNAATLSFLAKTGLAAAAVLAAATIAKKRTKHPSTLRGKIVLITGSRGLGLATAQELERRGARIALCARDAQELKQACELLWREQIEAAAFPADVNDASEIAPLVNRVLDRFGRIDILVNNAGEIRVGPLESLTHSDFEQAMDLMFWAAVNLTLEVLPHMKKRRSGQIVNITS